MIRQPFHILPICVTLLFTLPAWGTDASGIDVHFPPPEHDIQYKQPATTWDEALPLGNGILGALVWGDGKPVRISLDRTDLWDLRPVPEFHSPEYTYKQMVQWHHDGKEKDLIRVYEAPYDRPEAPTKIPAGRIELTFGNTPKFASARLSVRKAEATVQWDGDTGLDVFVHATQPVGMILARTSAEVSPRLIAPPFGGKGGKTGQGSLAKLGYPAPQESSGDNWQAFAQKGSQGFHFAVYFAWKKEQGRWLGAWSVASSFEGNDPLAIARTRVDGAIQAGFDSAFTTHTQWWDGYWRKSTVRLPNPTVERQWFLEQYKFGSASRRGSPPITLQGPWTADNSELPPWKGDYHHDLNTQLSYWPCYSANRLDEGLSYLDWLWKTKDNCVDWTKRFFDMSGMNVPMTADLNNNQIGGWRQYTHSATTAAWLAQHFYMHWRYSADREFLRDRAYPYLRDASVFIDAVTARKGSDNKRTLALSASPEINDNRPTAWFLVWTNYDLALTRWLLTATAELADELKQTDDATHWRQVLSELPEFSLADDGRLLVAKNYPLPDSHRHFSHLMAIHPLGLIDWEQGEASRKTIAAALAELDRLGPDWWCGYSYAWLANLAARARDGRRAERAIDIFAKAFCLRNSFHCNGDQSGKGWSKMTYRPFTLEGNFAAAAGVQEMLLQSHAGRIRVFPAIPDAWKDAAFTTLRAQGAFLISAVRENGATRRVDITSERGGTCRLISPFTEKPIDLEMQPGQTVTLTKDP